MRLPYKIHFKIKIVYIYYLDKDKMKSVDSHPIADFPITTKHILTDSMLIEYGFHYSYFGCIE